MNSFGQIIISESLLGESTLDLDLSPFANGVYFISLIDVNRVGQTKKLILQR